MEDFITFSSGTGVEGPGAFDEVAILASFFLAWVAFFFAVSSSSFFNLNRAR